MKKRNFSIRRNLWAALVLVALCGGCASQSELNRTAEPMVFVYGQGVGKVGPFQIGKQTRVVDILNSSGCHGCTQLRRVQLGRKLDGKAIRIDLVYDATGKAFEGERVRLQDGDLLRVPCSLLDPNFHGAPLVVKGVFRMPEKTVEQSERGR